MPGGNKSKTTLNPLKMSISKIQVEDTILKLSASFDFKFDDSLTTLLHTTIAEESLVEFVEICSGLMLLTKKQWIDKFGYNSKPSIGDWLSFFNKTPLDFTDIALLECLQVLGFAKKFSKDSPAYLFENRITNSVIESLGGLRSICASISTKDGYGIKDDLSFFKHDFQKTWLTFHKMHRGSRELTGNIKKCINPGVDYREIKFEANPVVYVPDLSIRNKDKLKIEYFN